MHLTHQKGGPVSPSPNRLEPDARHTAPTTSWKGGLSDQSYDNTSSEKPNTIRRKLCTLSMRPHRFRETCVTRPYSYCVTHPAFGPT